MLNKISEEVNSAGEYSITMDSTMDISTHDQCVFVLLYVRDTVNDNISIIDVIERVVALKKVVSSSKSYKRLNIYEGNNYRSSHLINIGATRWRCISDSVQKIFGRADISNAKSLLGRLTNYETTLTAMTFLQIFKLTTPLSDYLQTSNLDYIQAYRKIVVTEK
ncbi:hypothetical protein QTP88_005060 [Uroleucon formosanum]